MHNGYSLNFCFWVLCRCFYLAKSYSSAGKRTEAYALFCYARSLVDSALHQLANSPDKVCHCANTFFLLMGIGYPVEKGSMEHLYFIGRPSLILNDTYIVHRES
jgi:hypothetical protein